MAAGSMAGELMQLLSAHNYTECIQHLSNKEVFAQKLFVLTELSETHWLDTRKCYGQRRKNSNQVFELFGSFNDENPFQVRKDMIQHIHQNKSFYAKVGQEHLKRIKLTIDEWLLLMTLDSVFGDELMIYALLRVYQCHTVIFTSRSCWMTIGLDEPIDGNRLLEICQVHLLHIGLHMYAEIKSKPFVPVPKIAVTEAPIPVLPNLHDDSSPTNEAIDLSVKHSHTDIDQASTTTGDPSDTLFETQPERSDASIPYHIDSDVSDSLSDSLLPENSTVRETAPIGTLGINEKLNIPVTEDKESGASNCIPENTAMGTNTLEDTGNSCSGSDILENLHCVVLGTNTNIEPNPSDVKIGLNIDDNVSNHVVQGINLNKGDYTPSESLCTNINAGHKNKVVQSTAHPKGDPYNDAPLSGTLEKLSLMEWTVVDVLLSLPDITRNCTQKNIENVQPVSMNHQDPHTSTTEKSDSLQDQNVLKCPMQVTDTQNKLTESPSTKQNVELIFDFIDHSYCSTKNKNVPKADKPVVQPLHDDDNALDIINTTSNVPVHELSDSGIQIDMTTHDLMLNEFTRTSCFRLKWIYKLNIRKYHHRKWNRIYLP